MYNEVPISIISRQGLHLLYFNSCNIDNPDKIEAAYIEINRDFCCDRGSNICVSVNDYLSNEDERLLHETMRVNREPDNDYRILTDVSEAVKMIASGYVENKGIILRNMKYLCDPRLVLCYHPEKIYPRHECVFFEKKLHLLSYAHRVNSAWFFSGISDTITFFVCNMGTDDITIHLENSPNAVSNVEDAQRICVHPDQTVNIVPYKFSKFIRLVAVSSSENRMINCKIWFQTQLRS